MYLEITSLILIAGIFAFAVLLIWSYRKDLAVANTQTDTMLHVNASLSSKLGEANALLDMLTGLTTVTDTQLNDLLNVIDLMPEYDNPTDQHPLPFNVVEFNKYWTAP